MLAAVLVTAVGLVMGAAPLTWLVGCGLRRWGRTLAVRLAGARTVFDPRSTVRSVLPLIVLTFAVGVTIGQTRDARAVSTPTNSVAEVSASLDGVAESAAATLMRSSPYPVAMRVTSISPVEPSRTTLFIECARLSGYLSPLPVQLLFPTGCRPGATHSVQALPAVVGTVLDGVDLVVRLSMRRQCAPS
jgi:hypothetical protein